MNKFHLMPRTSFYEHIHFANPTTDTPDTSGLIGYKASSKPTSSSTLAVSVPVSAEEFEYKSLIHTIESAQGSNISITQNEGIATISANIEPSTVTGDTHFLAIINSSANLNNDGECWINTQAMFTDFTYRYVEVHIYNGAGNLVTPNNAYSFINAGQAIKLDFGSKDNYVTACSGNTKLYVHIEVAEAYAVTVSSTEPSIIKLDTSVAVAEYEEAQKSGLTDKTFDDSDLKDDIKVNKE